MVCLIYHSLTNSLQRKLHFKCQPCPRRAWHLHCGAATYTKASPADKRWRRARSLDSDLCEDLNHLYLCVFLAYMTTWHGIMLHSHRVLRNKITIENTARYFFISLHLNSGTLTCLTFKHSLTLSLYSLISPNEYSKEQLMKTQVTGRYLVDKWSNILWLWTYCLRGVRERRSRG